MSINFDVFADLAEDSVCDERMLREIAARMKWIKIFCSWVNTVKSWDADSIVNRRRAEKSKMISKARENFSKNRRAINIRGDSF